MMCSSNEVFHRPGRQLTELLRMNLTGGFTSGTTRYFKKGETRLRDEEGKHTQVTWMYIPSSSLSRVSPFLK